MKKFLIFKCDKNEKTQDLFCVLNGFSMESLYSKIKNVIKNDILLAAKYNSCKIFIKIGLAEKHDGFVEYGITAFIYPPYYKTLTENYAIREFLDK